MYASTHLLSRDLLESKVIIHRLARSQGLREFAVEERRENDRGVSKRPVCS